VEKDSTDLSSVSNVVCKAYPETDKKSFKAHVPSKADFKTNGLLKSASLTMLHAVTLHIFAVSVKS
jgi:hypothetical protein